MGRLVVQQIPLILANFFQLVDPILQLFDHPGQSSERVRLFGDHHIELLEQVLGVGKLNLEIRESLLSVL